MKQTLGQRRGTEHTAADGTCRFAEDGHLLGVAAIVLRLEAATMNPHHHGQTVGNGYANLTGLIHYYHENNSSDFHPEYNIFYDAGDFIRTYAPADVYQQWRQALDKAIVDRRMATQWATDKFWSMKYTDFTVTEEKFHGVSMFIPQDPATGYYARYNEHIKQMAWYAAVSRYLQS